jgi:glucarate dehydratase
MKVVKAHLTRIRVPLRRVYVSSAGLLTAYLKTVVRLYTEEGLMGLGETWGSPEVFAIARRLAEGLLGEDAGERVRLGRAFGPREFDNRNGRNGWTALGGVDMACWDLVAKRHRLPLHELFGGAVRERVPMVGELSPAPLAAPATAEEVDAFFAAGDGVDRAVAGVLACVKRDGYGAVKIKSTARDPAWDVRLTTALAEALGKDARLRHDPNAAYGPAEAIRVCRRLDRLGLQWFEDPAPGIEGMRRVRRRVRTPLATNMCVVRFEHLPPAVRLGAVDVVGVDVYHWGGFAAARDLIAACRALGLGIFVHSVFELGPGTAANLHLAAALSDLDNGVDTCLPQQGEDIIEGGGFRVRGGHLDVPKGPGLGVALDEAAVARFALEEFTAAL